VQSDPASPTPGQNRINALSRAAYFIFIGSIALILDAVVKQPNMFSPLCVFGFDYNNQLIITFTRDGLFIFILFFPLLFTLGWMPQFDTFIIVLLEHIEMHIFGGTASTGLLCSVYSIVRSSLVVLTLSPLGYAAFVSLETDTSNFVGNNCSVTFYTYSNSTLPMPICTFGGRVALSFFLGSLVSLSYVLSRATSNHRYLLDLIQLGLKKLWYKMRHTYNVAPPVDDPIGDMYRKVTLKRLLSDIIIACILLVTVTILCITTVFCRNIIPAYVIYTLTALLGIVNHYILPHVRKETPWLLFSKPCIKSNEYHQFEVTGKLLC
jgi:hypothetical protein